MVMRNCLSSANRPGLAVPATPGRLGRLAANFYTNFAPFRSDRVEPIVERLLADAEMRSVIFPLADSPLAQALQAIARMAYEEGARYGGFWGFDTSNVEDWIRQHLQPEA